MLIVPSKAVQINTSFSPERSRRACFSFAGKAGLMSGKSNLLCSCAKIAEAKQVYFVPAQGAQDYCRVRRAVAGCAGLLQHA